MSYLFHFLCRNVSSILNFKGPYTHENNLWIGVLNHDLLCHTIIRLVVLFWVFWVGDGPFFIIYFITYFITYFINIVMWSVNIFFKYFLVFIWPICWSPLFCTMERPRINYSIEVIVYSDNSHIPLSRHVNMTRPGQRGREINMVLIKITHYYYWKSCSFIENQGKCNQKVDWLDGLFVWFADGHCF